MKNFNFSEMRVIEISNLGHCDADGNQGSGCDCDSPN